MICSAALAECDRRTHGKAIAQQVALLSQRGRAMLRVSIVTFDSTLPRTQFLSRVSTLTRDIDI